MPPSHAILAPGLGEIYSVNSGTKGRRKIKVVDFSLKICPIFLKEHQAKKISDLNTVDCSFQHKKLKYTISAATYFSIFYIKCTPKSHTVGVAKEESTLNQLHQHNKKQNNLGYPYVNSRNKAQS